MKSRISRLAVTVSDMLALLHVPLYNGCSLFEGMFASTNINLFIKHGSSSEMLTGLLNVRVNSAVSLIWVTANDCSVAAKYKWDFRIHLCYTLAINKVSVNTCPLNFS